MKNLAWFNTQIPNIIDEIMIYFAAKGEETIKEGRSRTVQTLTGYFKETYDFDMLLYHKELVKICDLLCEYAPLVRVYHDSDANFKNCYYWNEKLKDGIKYPDMSFEERKRYFDLWENQVFGSRYIYEKYQHYIVPIVHTKENGDESIGTGFLVSNYMIVTARHCIEGAKHIAIGTIEISFVEDSQVYFHKNAYIDVAIIIIKPLEHKGLLLSMDYHIFDKVITMGYPKIPGFTCFQTAEEATISAVPHMRFVATEGAISAEGQQIWNRENMFLITAKIKGGNSGGPVINSCGYCIGLVSEIPFAEGEYDDLGYGTAVPAHFIYDMAENISEHEKIENVVFVEYPY